jgi:hypothetical protein
VTGTVVRDGDVVRRARQQCFLTAPSIASASNGF